MFTLKINVGLWRSAEPDMVSQQSWQFRQATIFFIQMFKWLMKNLLIPSVVNNTFDNAPFFDAIWPSEILAQTKARIRAQQFFT